MPPSPLAMYVVAQLSFVHAVEAAMRYGRTDWEAGRERLGVTPVQALVVAALAEADGASERGLADRLHMPLRGVRQAVGHLVGTGRAEREGAEVWLTAPGRDVRSALAAALHLAA